MVVQCAALGADHVHAQALAAQVARAHAVGAAAGADGVAASRPGTGFSEGARVRVSRGRAPGDTADWVHVELRLRTRAFRRLGLSLDVVGRAAARVQ